MTDEFDIVVLRLRQFEFQRGVVLYIAMVMLFIMALIGVAGLTVSTKEERLSANFLDNNIAFQAAEAALMAGERTATELAERNDFLTDYFDDSNGRWLTQAVVGGNKPWEGAAWDSTDSMEVTAFGTNPPVAAAPRFMLEYISEINALGTEGGVGVMECSYGQYCGGSPPMMLVRVTGRGVGTNAATTEMLQSLIRVRKMKE